MMEPYDTVGQGASDKPGRKWVVWAVATLVLVVLILAIAIPQYLTYGARARQAEARVILGEIYIAEVEFFSKYGRFGRTFDEIGFKPEGTYRSGRRYTYRIDRSGKPGTVIPPDGGAIASTGEPYGVVPDNTKFPAGVTADGQHFIATATANIDNDAIIDQWHVDDMKCCLKEADVDDVR